MTPTVLVERDGAGVARVVLNRADRRNALNTPMWRELGSAIDEVAARADDRVCILTGAGADFSTGGDLADSSSLAEGAEAGMRRASDVVRTLHRMPKPTIAAVRGRVIGGGLGLALTCDIVVASETTVMWPVFTRRALTLDCGASWTLPRLVGLQRAKELTFLAEPVPAERAAALGLIAHLVPDDDLEPYVGDLADRLAALPGAALAWNKELLDNSLSRTMDQALEEEIRLQTAAAESPAFKAAVRIFFASRTARQ